MSPLPGADGVSRLRLSFCKRLRGGRGGGGVPASRSSKMRGVRGGGGGGSPTPTPPPHPHLVTQCSHGGLGKDAYGL